VKAIAQCRWCGQPTGAVPICSAKCFALAQFCGWWDAAKIMRRQELMQRGAMFRKELEKRNNNEKQERKPVAFERKPNQCGLFVNTKSPDKSDYNAQIDVQCPNCNVLTSYWVNGWRKVSNSGMKFISLALRAKQSRASATVDDSDVPF
jgi:hypothetical protein